MLEAAAAAVVVVATVAALPDARVGWRSRAEGEQEEEQEEQELGRGRRGSVMMRREGGTVTVVRAVVERPLPACWQTGALAWAQERKGLGTAAAVAAAAAAAEGGAGAGALGSAEVATVVPAAAAVVVVAATGPALAVFARFAGVASAAEEGVVDDEGEAPLPGQGGRARLQEQSRRWRLA